MSVETEFGSMVPKDKNREEQQDLAEKKEKALLEMQASFLGVAHSEATRKLIEMVNEQLVARIETLIENDGEARMCIKMLGELGVKKGLAQGAAKKLQDKYFKIED